MRDEASNRILITRTERERLYVARIGNCAEYLLREVLPRDNDAREGSETGAIYCGRVEHIVDNLDAAFVRYTGKQNGYLPLKELPAGSRELRNGDVLPVQVVAPARGSKQPRLTAKLSLTGQYTVLIMGDTGVGCSAKLPTEERSKLTAAVRERLEEEGHLSILDHAGLIIRTEAARAADGEPNGIAALIVKEAVSLDARLMSILKTASTRTALTKLIEGDRSADLYEHFVRLVHFLEAANKGPVIVTTDDPSVAKELRTSGLLTSHPDITLNVPAPGESDMITVYGLKKLLRDVERRVVHLPSGGQIVIDHTEAMCVIDVNSAKDIRKRRRTDESVKEDEALRINLEAAVEAMRQIRLRNITGMILIDLINMKAEGAYNTLREKLLFLASCDPVKTRFVDFTTLGIAEITRRSHA